jgi:sialic acid synthase SpsE
MIILDFGSGDTCQNDLSQIEAMIDAIPLRDDIVIKWQLFENEKIGPYQVQRLQHQNFDAAYGIAKQRGIKTTASVFDKSSLDFLLNNFYVPFVKIACQTEKYGFRKRTYELIDSIPRGMPVVVSCEDIRRFELWSVMSNSKALCCIPEYPAKIIDYAECFSSDCLRLGISDHTIGLYLYHRFNPLVYEKHFCLSWQTSLDKEWSVDEETVKELLCC